MCDYYIHILHISLEELIEDAELMRNITVDGLKPFLLNVVSKLDSENQIQLDWMEASFGVFESFHIHTLSLSLLVFISLCSPFV